MLEPLVRAVSQLNDPVFLGVVWRSLALSLLAFLALLTGSVWLLESWVGQGGWPGGWLGGWLSWLIGILGGAGVLLLAVWLFVPVALLIATLYIDRVAGAVERRFYPGLPPPAGAPLAEQTWDGVILATQVLVLQVVALVASLLLPGLGLVLGYVITGWAIGRGLFVAVAMRRMSRPNALRVYRARRLVVVAPGIALALASTLPPLNLLVPVVGIAAMVHVLLEH
jgi:CysZ protein